MDDNPLELRRVKRALESGSGEESFLVESFRSADAFLQRLRMKSSEEQALPEPDLFLIDYDLAEGELAGTSLASECRRLYPSKAVIFLSSHHDPRIVSQAFTAGADDFISKDTEASTLHLRITQSAQLVTLKKGWQTPPNPSENHAIVGATMERIARRIPFLMNSAVSSVLVEGESGTGKEVVADLFEYHTRPGQPFVRVSCAEIAPTLLEGELFGYRKGAFTGALQDKEGLIEAASGGWLFLDEIALLSLSAQGALLRVLESQSVRRLGESKPRKINVRLLCAGNEPLEGLVSEKRFRNDLWQRIKEVEIALPPLRSRPEEIKVFIEHFCRRLPGGPYQITEPALRLLAGYSYQHGNIRELRNTLKAMTEFRMGQTLTPLSIPETIWKWHHAAKLDPALRSESEKSGLPSQAPDHESNPKSAYPIGQDDCTYENLCDLALASFLKEVAGRYSLRTLAKKLDLSRMTLSTKMNRLVAKNLISEKEVKTWTRSH